ncbi:MAG: hypothetical protein AB7V50_08405 [Vampirovibrionia bacterium]
MLLNNIQANLKLHSPQPAIKKETVDQPKTEAVNYKTMPASAWQANMMPFGSIKLPVSDFQTKMQNKIDQIRKGTFKRHHVPKAEAFQMKEKAIKNISGPLVLECSGIDTNVLADLNKEFAQVTSKEDLYKLIQDTRIPDNTPITITEPFSDNYKAFIKEVDRGNATNDIKQATEIVEKASKEMKGSNIEIPELEIKVSRKVLLLNIIDHLNAGLKYEPLELVASPHVSFVSGDEVDINLIKPVYER